VYDGCLTVQPNNREGLVAVSTKSYTNPVSGEAKRKQFAIRMRPTVHEAGLRAAANQNRSLASLMETLLIEHLKEGGYLPTSGKPASKKK
jgi:hypothetical protein